MHGGRCCLRQRPTCRCCWCGCGTKSGRWWRNSATRTERTNAKLAPWCRSRRRCCTATAGSAVLHDVGLLLSGDPQRGGESLRGSRGLLEESVSSRRPAHGIDDDGYRNLAAWIRAVFPADGQGGTTVLGALHADRLPINQPDVVP